MKTISNKSRKIFSWLLYLSYILLILISVDYIFYRFYRKRIYTPPPESEQLPKVKDVDPLTMSRLGDISPGRSSCFVNFKTKKTDRTVRIGCFGDSFTYGAGVVDGNDYPSLLQNLFIARGYENVEVINFGSNWYGFHQTFMIWKYIGQKYDLNYVLLGPSGFQYHRDCKFNHTGGSNIYYMHARYIVSNNQVKLIDVIGDTYPERMRYYYRFLPPLRYLRFDKQAPPFLMCLIPGNRELKNPFYYYRGPLAEEMDKIYKMLLSEMADNEPSIVLGHYEKHIANLGQELDRDNLRAVYFYRPESFPYISVNLHNSSLANQLLAQQMFDCLTNKTESNLEILKFQDISTELSSQIEMRKLKLSEYAKAEIEINNIKIGCFEESVDWTNVDCQLKAASLLVIKNNDTSILDACFLPLDFEVKEDMVLETREQTELGTREYQLGRVELLNPGLNIGKVTVDGFDFNYLRRALVFQDESESTKEGDIIKKGGKVTILLNNKPILLGNIRKLGERLKLLPVKYAFIALRAQGSEAIDVKNLDKTGIVYLFLSKYDGEEIKIPFAKWMKVIERVPLEEDKILRDAK